MKKTTLLAIAGALIVTIAIGLNFFGTSDVDPQATAPAKSPVTSSARGPAPTVAERPAPPTFDVVRVNTLGDAVIAGRAAPNSRVQVLDGDKPLGETRADSYGEWVFLPTDPLSPGNRELSLLMHVDGRKPIPSDATVVLVVPEWDQDLLGRPAKGTTALALKIPRDGKGPSQILQFPGTNTTGKKLTINTLDYDDAGKVGIRGRAKPDSTVRLYLDNAPIGESQVDEDGGWTLSPNRAVPPGKYSLRADQVDATGKVVSRVDIPFSRTDVTNLPEGKDLVIVQPGNSLWRLARRTYGIGMNYTVIFEANADQITNPDLIYPGQIFALPKPQ